MYTRLFENLKTRILKSIITWSEMVQKQPEVQMSIESLSDLLCRS